MSAPVTGICTIKLDGQLQRSDDKATLDIGGEEREMVTGHKVYGHRTKAIKPSMVEFKIAHQGDTDLIALAALVDSTLEFECDTGITYLVTGGTVTKTLKLAEGWVSVEIQGDPAIEL